MSVPRRISFIRHCESQGNVDTEIYKTIPDHLIELTPNGRDQANTLGMNLKNLIGDGNVMIYCSPYTRVRQTFEISSGHFKDQVWKYYEDPRLVEQSWGNLRPDIDEDLRKQREAYGHFFYRIPAGESGLNLYTRVSGFYDTMWRDFKKPSFPDDVFIYSHGLTTRMLVTRWFHWTYEQYEKLRNPKNGAIITMVRGNDGKFQLTEPMEQYAE